VRPPEKLIVRAPIFLSEQDGPSERVLKEQLSLYFDTDKRISAAYLARADLGNIKGETVVLCLRVDTDQRDDFVSNVGIIFSNLFNADEKLDIMFLTSEDEMRLGEVCGPFYLQATSGPN
jgi:hypothetical protein